MLAVVGSVTRKRRVSVATTTQYTAVERDASRHRREIHRRSHETATRGQQGLARSRVFIMAAVRSTCGHYIFILWFLLLAFFLLAFFLLLSFFFFSSPNLSGHRVGVYHNLHMVWP